MSCKPFLKTSDCNSMSGGIHHYTLAQYDFANSTQGRYRTHSKRGPIDNLKQNISKLGLLALWKYWRWNFLITQKIYYNRLKKNGI